MAATRAAHATLGHDQEDGFLTTSRHQHSRAKRWPFRRPSLLVLSSLERRRHFDHTEAEKMTQRIEVALPYSILDICDADLSDPLEPSRNHIHWSDKAVRIACLNEFDGNTTVVFGPAQTVALNSMPVFDGQISTPSGKVVAVTAHLEIIAIERVQTKVTRVRIWENQPIEPDEIVVALG